MTNASLQFTVLGGVYSVCHLPQDDAITMPDAGFFCVLRSDDELTIIAEEALVEGVSKQEKGWNILKLMGPFDFDVKGVLAEVSAVLAEANIAIFVLSSFATDYILIKQENKQQAISALEKAGHRYQHV